MGALRSSLCAILIICTEHGKWGLPVPTTLIKLLVELSECRSAGSEGTMRQSVKESLICKGKSYPVAYEGNRSSGQLLPVKLLVHQVKQRW